MDTDATAPGAANSTAAFCETKLTVKMVVKPAAAADQGQQHLRQFDFDMVTICICLFNFISFSSQFGCNYLSVY